MKAILIAILAIAIAASESGCVGVRNVNEQDYAKLIDFGQDGVVVLISKREWEGFWGPEGYIGLVKRQYRAGLHGMGPVFVNPRFQDNPPDIHCIGTVTLDREHEKVIIDMRRILSKPGEPERTRPHPANGAYRIESTRRADPDEHPF
jgi:hypothetical protein